MAPCDQGKPGAHTDTPVSDCANAILYRISPPGYLKHSSRCQQNASDTPHLKLCEQYANSAASSRLSIALNFLAMTVTRGPSRSALP